MAEKRQGPFWQRPLKEEKGKGKAVEGMTQSAKAMLCKGRDAALFNGNP